MAVDVETGSLSSKSATNSAAFTWSHTTNGQALLVIIASDQSTHYPLSVSYDSVDMGAPLAAVAFPIGVGKLWAFLLESPAAGTHTLAVTVSAQDAAGFTAYALGLTGFASHRTVTTGTGDNAPTLTDPNSVSGDLVIGAFGGYTLPSAVNNGTQLVRATVYTNVSIASRAASGPNTVIDWTGGTYWGGVIVSCVAAANAWTPRVTMVMGG